MNPATTKIFPKTSKGLSIWRMPALLAIVLTIVMLTLNAGVQKNFFAPYIVASNLTTFLPLMMIAVGQAYVVLGGSIDLSLGSIVSLVNVVVVVLVEHFGGTNQAIFLAMAIGLGLGTLCGVLNGVLIGWFRLQAIVTTFATGVVFGGLALLVLPQAGGALPGAYYITYGETFFGLPFVFYLMLALIVFVIWAAKTKIYAHLVAIGGNRQAAFQSGLSVIKGRIISHGFAGFFSAAAALSILGVAGAGDPLMGQAFTLSSVSAVVLGGVALSGGWGGAGGAILGAAILGLINNLIFFANINYVYQSIVQSTIVLIALAGGVFFSRKPQ